jgi:hypothetical protein
MHIYTSAGFKIERENGGMDIDMDVRKACVGIKDLTESDSDIPF